MSENKNRTQAPRPAFPMRGGGGRRGGRIVEKPKDFKKALKRLLKYISRRRLPLTFVALFSALSTVFSVSAPIVQGQATTEIYKGAMGALSGSGGIDMQALGRILFILGLLYLISALFSLAQTYIMNGITQKLGFELRQDINEKLMRLPMDYFDRRTHGEILSYITNDVDTVTQGISQSVTQIITSLATLIGVLYMMLSINVLMTAAVLLVLPFSGFIVSRILKLTQPLFKARQAELAKVNGIVEECYGGQTVLQAFNHQNASIADFQRENKALYEISRKSEFLGSFMHPVMDFMGNISYVAVAVLGAYSVSVGYMEIGAIQSFIQYSKRFSQPINQVARTSNMLQSTMAAAERVFGLLDEQEEPLSENAALDGDTKGGVSFKHVRFGYLPGKTVINDFSADIRPGSRVAIVGPTGSGKTTLIKLLMRFYDVQEGYIEIDGRDIRKMRRSGLRSLFGMVLQDTWLFSGTIEDNIKYGRPEASPEDVRAAAEAAMAAPFINQLPQGYKTILGEDSDTISQGQKQLLTIARAFLKDPRILILDEATSSVDTMTEVMIQKAMDSLMKNRTCFIIAHRLSTIRSCDNILVMRSGDIVEQGTHGQLLEKDGFYAGLYNSQFETGEREILDLQ